MIFEIVNTILLLCSLMLNIKILNITHNIKNKNKIQNPSASLADTMSCDNCEACDSRDIRDSCVSRDIRKENNVSRQNIYTDGMDGSENDKAILLENNRLGEKREWADIRIAK